MLNPPLKVGQAYFFCTVTLYYVGQVEEMGMGWVRLSHASWVHWTGRLSILHKRKSFTHRDLASRKPRVEPIGDMVLATNPLVAIHDWPVEELPTTPIE